MAAAGSTAYDAFLSPQEAETVLNLVSEALTDGWSFETISKQFNTSFPKGDHYRVGRALEMFLLCGILDTPIPQLTAVFLLYDMYKEFPLACNPFAPLFYKLLHPEEQEKLLHDLAKDSELGSIPNDEVAEHLSRTGFSLDATDWFVMGLAKFPPGCRRFLAALTTTPPADMFTKQPAFFCKIDGTSTQPLDTAHFDKEFLERQDRVPVMERSGVSCVVDYPDVTVVGSRQESGRAARETAELLSSGQKPQPDLTFIPELMRPIPTIMPLNRRELVWMNPQLVEELKMNLDPTMLVIPPKWLAVSSLITKSVRSPLHVDEQNSLISAFEADPTLVLGGAVMTPEDILGIVENNPGIATEIFKRVHKIPDNAIRQTRFKKYLQAFLTTNVTVHTMEVINRLHEAKVVPSDFLPLYVSYALRKCDSTSTSESTYNQNRLVRLVCVFLQSAVRNKSLNLSENPDLLIEIQAFCVKQTTVKEAVALYRLLKTSQSHDASDSSEAASNDSPAKEKARK
ncbi:LOW QUALITY PROTEIN: CCR4-NOT transcription complex subunit 11-like [Paramacrobiotus metropolitanus]|uniref:LOW QUALITY PROTEIN: CCR4-NOT transcription complex subunit 11-like n=1 Tax=Paramacrobiotus metropolitanus TaxID=2943436 RepID=UPI0024464053|nr:LOW QUALITY PROTEIN: CCR4-NOT transcription complex subunit 11-like [Paramacrobiotus metropolitanus]